MNKHIPSLLVLLMALAVCIHTGIAYFYLHQPWQFTAYTSIWLLLLSIQIYAIEESK